MVKALPLALLGVMGLAVTWAAAEAPQGQESQQQQHQQQIVIAAETPRAVAVVTRAGETIRGEAVALRDDALVLRTGDQAERAVAWTQLPAATVYRVVRGLMDQKDARQWLVLGRQLRRLPDGAELSDSALDVAALLDESLAGEVETARQIVPPAPAEAPDQHVSAAPTATDAAGAADAAMALDPARYTWGGFAETDRPRYIDQTRAYADRVAQTLGVTFITVETKYFLYYTNIPPRDTFHSPRLLDQMYDKACDLYGIPRGVNLFKGKCAVFMFDTQEQFKRYAAEFGGPAWAAGFCQQSGNGDVRIVMFQGTDRSYTIQTMLHETAHGVSWRHRAPRFLPPWLEEGIAEWVASNTTRDFRYVTAKKQRGAAHLREARKLGGNFFGEPGIREAWEYGVSLALTQMLIDKDRDKFIRFVQAIKDGQTWEVSLSEHFGIAPDEFIARYGRSIGVRDLTR